MPHRAPERSRRRRARSVWRGWARTGRGRRAGELIEQIPEIIGNCGISGQQAQISVEARRRGVVVARADMRIAPDLAVLPAGHQGDLRVVLEADHAVDDLGTGPLELP